MLKLRKPFLFQYLWKYNCQTSSPLDSNLTLTFDIKAHKRCHELLEEK